MAKNPHRFRKKGFAKEMHAFFGITESNIGSVFGPGFTNSDLSRVVQLNDGAPPSWSPGKLHQWFDGIRVLYEQKTGTLFRWFDVFQGEGVRPESSTGPRVSYIQRFSSAGLYQDLIQAVRQISRYLGWDLKVCTGTGNESWKETLDHVSDAIRNRRHIIFDLPYPKEVLDELEKAATSGLSVVACGVQERRLFHRVNVNNESLGELLGRAVKEEFPGTKAIILADPKLTYPHDVRVRGIKKALHDAIEIVGINDAPFVESCYEAVQQACAEGPIRPVISISRGCTEVALGALASVKWSKRVPLFSTDLSADWLHEFGAWESWRAIAGFDAMIVSEVACRVLDLAIRNPDLVPNRPEFLVNPYLIRRGDLQNRQHWTPAELVKPMVLEERREIARQMWRLGFCELSPLEG